MDAAFYRWEGQKLILRLRVQPRASRNSLGEPLGDRLKVYLTAPPVEGKANAALQAFLAEVFGVAKGSVHIRRGEQGREKEVEVLAPRRVPNGIAAAKE